VEELRALVVELVQANTGLREVIAAKDHQIASLGRRIAELERQLGADSSTSSRHRRRIRRIASRRGVRHGVPRGVGRVSNPGIRDR
jgi:hypothetical protein